MDSKIKTLIVILVVGVIFMGGWGIGSDRIYPETQEVTITTDKTEYEQGVTVKITIKNNLDTPLRNYDTRVAIETSMFFNQNVGWGFIEKLEEGNWIKIEPLWRCGDTCFAKCKLGCGFFVLGAKGTTEFPQDFRHFEWNQTRLICDPEQGRTIGSEPVGAGVYRISSTFWDENKDVDTKTVFYSNEFTIK